MFDFLYIQYKLGNLNDIQLNKYVEIGCITSKEYEQICGKEVV